MQTNSPKFFRFTAAALIIALCNFSALSATSTLAINNSSSQAKDDSQIAGQLISSGIVTVNDKRAIAGATIFTNARVAVACTKGSTAIINLGRLGRLELSPGAKMVVRFSEGLISGDLLEGKAVVSTPVGTKISINTPDGVISSAGHDAVVTPVNSQRGARCAPGMAIVRGAAIGSGALAAILVGLGGTAAADAVVATASQTTAGPVSAIR